MERDSTSMEPDSALYAAWPGRATQIDMLWSYFVASDGLACLRSVLTRFALRHKHSKPW